MATTYIARPAGFPSYPEPWNLSSVTQATPFFRFQQLMKEQQNVTESVRKEHYTTLIEAMCGSPISAIASQVTTMVNWANVDFPTKPT